MVNIPRPYVIGSALATVVGVGYILKDRFGGLPYQGTEDLSNKVFIVTGANSGIGKEVVNALAKQKAKVIMACRDMNKCEEVRKPLVLETRNKYIYCRKCDLASQESIRNFVEQFKKEHSRLDVLINNAAVMRCPKSHTRDGIEIQLGVNHIGHFLLTNLLLDHLKSSAPSRIVNVSGHVHYSGKINKEDFNSDNSYDPAVAYNQSKLATCLFTKELAKKLKGTGVTVNVVNPGIADTELTRHMSFHNSYFSTIILKPILFPFTRSAKQAARNVLNVALNPEYEKETGKYFSENKEKEMSEEAQDEKLANWLWLVSSKWTRLDQ